MAEKKIQPPIYRPLPEPEITGINDLLYLTEVWATGTYKGVEYSVDRGLGGTTFVLTAKLPDGTEIREAITFRGVINAWVQGAIEERVDGRTWIVQQRISDHWDPATKPLAFHEARHELIELTSANPDDEFRLVTK